MFRTSDNSGSVLESGAGESEPLLQLGDDNSFQPGEPSAASASIGSTDNDGEEVLLTKRQLWSLYLSHFLSTWNARGYEFAAVRVPYAALPLISRLTH